MTQLFFLTMKCTIKQQIYHNSILKFKEHNSVYSGLILVAVHPCSQKVLTGGSVSILTVQVSYIAWESGNIEHFLKFIRE